MGLSPSRAPGRKVAQEQEVDMAFEALKAEVALLLQQMQNEAADRQELALQILEKLNEMRAFGMPLPQDLVDLEAALEAEHLPDGTQSE